MIILGISGFEDSGGSRRGSRHTYTYSYKQGIEDILTFSNGRAPFQCFPLHLIGHDCSAALVMDGKLIAAASEERFTRIKHGFNLTGGTVLPRRAIEYCLEQAGISWRRVDVVAHYCHFTEEAVNERLYNVSRRLSSARIGLLRAEYEQAFRNRLSPDVVRGQIERIAGRAIPVDRFIPVKHHLAHAAGAFYGSGFQRSAILTLDGYGEKESSLWAIGEGNKITPHRTIQLPTSLGLLYQVITAYLGFHSFGDEYKVMGLSSYGDPAVFGSFFDDWVQLLPEGAYQVEGLSRPNLLAWLRERLGEIPNKGVFSKKAADIAAALQKKLEEVILHSARFLKKHYHTSNICISGGVGLNARANGALLRSGMFRRVFIQPAAADDGAGLGAALFALHDRFNRQAQDPFKHVFWGPAYGPAQVETALRGQPGLTWRKEPAAATAAAQLLAQGKIVGWFRGRMETGPRALGARSILADPRSASIRDTLNEKIKNRESFRPFAPAVLEDRAAEFFHVPEGFSAPFMLMIFDTRAGKRGLIPAVVHVDGSARLQTVAKEQNPLFYKLIRAFYDITGIPLVLNTSFNRAGEPIVNSPEDALKCFLACGLDALLLEDYLVLNKPGVE
jgi:carbamoyltransferase